MLCTHCDKNIKGKSYEFNFQVPYEQKSLKLILHKECVIQALQNLTIRTISDASNFKRSEKILFNHCMSLEKLFEERRELKNSIRI